MTAQMIRHSVLLALVLALPARAAPRLAGAHAALQHDQRLAHLAKLRQEHKDYRAQAPELLSELSHFERLLEGVISEQQYGKLQRRDGQLQQRRADVAALVEAGGTVEDQGAGLDTCAPGWRALDGFRLVPEILLEGPDG